MSNAAFVVPLADLERGPKEVTWTIGIDWLQHALADTDASPNGEGELTLELTKTGKSVMVRGKARAKVTMPCSRTLDPVEIDLGPDIFLMLAQAAPEEPPRRPRKAKGGRRGAPEPQKGKAKSKGGGWSADPELQDEDAARDTFTGEQIVLDPFVREFLLLDLPMFPLRSDLPSDAPAAIAPASQEKRIDPRLAPLAEIASRLQSDKE